MRVVINGTAAAVETRSYEGKNGKVTVADVFIGTAPYFDKVSMPLDICPAPGEQVSYVANVKAKTVTGKRDGQPYTFLDVWCVERLPLAPALHSVPQEGVAL